MLHFRVESEGSLGPLCTITKKPTSCKSHNNKHVKVIRPPSLHTHKTGLAGALVVISNDDWALRFYQKRESVTK